MTGTRFCNSFMAMSAELTMKYYTKNDSGFELNNEKYRQLLSNFKNYTELKIKFKNSLFLF